MIAAALTPSPGVAPLPSPAPAPAPAFVEGDGEAFASLLGALQAALPDPVSATTPEASAVPSASTPLEIERAGVSAPMIATSTADLSRSSALLVEPSGQGEKDLLRLAKSAKQDLPEPNLEQAQLPAVTEARAGPTHATAASAPLQTANAESAPVEASKPRAPAAPVSVPAIDTVPTAAPPVAEHPEQPSVMGPAVSPLVAPRSSLSDAPLVDAALPAPPPFVAPVPPSVAPVPQQIGDDAAESGDVAPTRPKHRGSVPSAQPIAQADRLTPDRLIDQAIAAPLPRTAPDSAVPPAAGARAAASTPVIVGAPVQLPPSGTPPFTSPITATIAAPLSPIGTPQDDGMLVASGAGAGPKRNVARRVPVVETLPSRAPVVTRPAEPLVAPPPALPQSPVPTAASAPLADPAPVIIVAPVRATPDAQPLTPSHPSLAGALLAHRLEGAFAAGDVPRDWAQAFDAGGAARVEARTSSLGPVAIEVARATDGVAITLGASTPDARVVLAEAQPRLAADARAAGVALTQSRVDDTPHGERRGNGGGNGRGRQPQSRHPTLNPIATTVSSSAADRYA